MKKLLTLLAFATICIIGCSKSNDPVVETPMSLGNDSLVSRLNLKITDKIGLKVIGQLFTATDKSTVIAGTKNEEYWYGYFDASGNEITTRTYKDPKEMNVGYGGKMQLNSISFRQKKQIGRFIYINRFLSEDKSLGSGLYEIVTRIEVGKKNITDNISEVVGGSDVPYTSMIGSWANGGTVISKTKIDIYGFSTERIHYIYDSNLTLLKSFSTSNLNANYIPLTETEYLNFIQNSVARINTSNPENPIYETDTKPSVELNAIVTLSNRFIEGDILFSVFSVTKFNGEKYSVTTKMNISTGVITQ